MSVLTLIINGRYPDAREIRQRRPWWLAGFCLLNFAAYVLRRGPR